MNFAFQTCDVGRVLLGRLLRILGVLSLGIMLFGDHAPIFAQSQNVPAARSAGQRTQAPASSDKAQQQTDQSTGTIAGTIVDPDGALVPGAKIKLTLSGESSGRETVSDSNGQFYFLNVRPGDFQLTISVPNFTPQTVSGTVQGGEHYVTPAIMLALATQVTSVTVLTPEAEAEIEVHQEEKQRVLGVIPNYFVSYVPNAAPLSAKQKFSLAWKSSSDPVTIGLVAGVAGAEQATDAFKGYGFCEKMGSPPGPPCLQWNAGGATGYFKRFGATYADVVDGTFMGGAIFPVILKQDPRYFYKGTGSFKSRLFYALSMAFICQGDNKKWEPNYSNILGNLAAGGIANAYYPASNRGLGLTFQTAGIRIGETALAGVFQEFIVHKLTPNIPDRNTKQP